MMKDKKIIFQKLIKNHIEYTIDLYFNKSSKLIAMVAREKNRCQKWRSYKNKNKL